MVNRRVIVSVIVIVVLFAAGWGVTRYRQARGTPGWVEQLPSNDYGTATRAMNLLQNEGVGAPALLGKEVASEVPSIQWRSAQILGEIGDSKQVEPLSGALKSPDPTVRAAAALALGKLQTGSALNQLIALAQQDPAQPVRIAACQALALVGSGQAVRPLAALLQERGKITGPKLPDDKWELRAAVVTTLGCLGGSQAVAPLGATATSGSEPVAEVRMAAAYALGDVATQLRSDAELSPAVASLELAARDADPQVRIAAIHSLTRFSPPAALTREVEQTMSTAAADPEFWVRAAAERGQAG